MRLLAVSLIASAFFAFAPSAQAQVRAGEYEEAGIETGHPYLKSGAAEPQMTRQDVVAYADATYIAVHFETFDLAPGDYVVVKDPDGKQSWTYSGLGKKDLGRSETGFFAGVVWGDVALVELYTAGHEPGYGYKIDFFGRGYNADDIAYLWSIGLGEELKLPQPGEWPNRSVCTADDSEEAKCYQATEPPVYEESRAVVRLLITGAFWCTGWLVGCDGELMTNEHCIGTQTEADNTTFDFMAEGADCGTDCRSGGACGGTIEANSSTLIQSNAALDYTLVQVDSATDLPATYGYMQLRGSGPVLDERIYIPQHPAGWGKRVALESSYPGEGGLATVVSLSEPGCSGPQQEVGYWADTRGGSSGSPVLGYDDNLVVALHHCRGSAFCSSGTAGDDPNRGVAIQDIIADLGANLPECALGCDGGETPVMDAALTAANAVELTWTGSLSGLYDVYRADGDCPQSSSQLIATDVAGTSFLDDTVVEGQTYSYAVQNVTDPDCASDLSACDSVFIMPVPTFGYYLWNNPATYHPFHDGNANGLIDILEMVFWLNTP